METSLYVSLTGQMATERRLTTIADNIANMNTVGFRQVGVRFSELIGGLHNSKTSFVSPAVSTLSNRQGALDATGGSLDFAINGRGWFKIETPAGEALTRDGRFQIGPNGTLTNLEGFPVLDQGGAPVQVNQNGGQLVVDQTGILFQRGAIVGSIGVFEADRIVETMRIGSTGVLPADGNANAVDAADYSLVQGYTEKSNVDPVEQIARLISVQRNFEQTSALMQKSEAALEEAIRLLGGK